ncbi:MAG: sugar transferase [Candidatus Nanosyncoccaceae bacterium]|jgi:O-antigen biosynthesis protein WbqP
MYKVIKRLADLLFSVVLLALGIVPGLIIAIIIKLDSPGPVFFKQKRYGKDMKVFEIYKFRTMKVDVPHNLPTRDAVGFDHYFTKFGKIIRRVSIDELPQIINIIKGEMSFVGPRPVIVEEKELVELRQPLGANSVRPGLTGWAQVNGRDTVEYEEKAEMDGYYAKNISFKLDMICLLKTFGVLTKGHEYNMDENEIEIIKKAKAAHNK